MFKKNYIEVCFTTEDGIQHLRLHGYLKRNDIPVKTVVLNNEYLGMVRQWQDLFFDKRYSSVCLTADAKCDGCGVEPECKKRDTYYPDFIKLSESYGIPARRVTDPSKVREALEWAHTTEGPIFLEIMTSQEENVYPMVPAGAALDEIMLDEEAENE